MLISPFRLAVNAWNVFDYMNVNYVSSALSDVGRAWRIAMMEEGKFWER
jgi:hypothetical protein